MSYEVTATRRRPRRFADLKGQEFVVATLCNSIRSGRIAPAYLFYGPRGVGKTSAARILASALNVPEGPRAEDWDAYPGSKEIERGTSMDVIEIDGASNTGVNDIRAIKDQVLFPPAQLRYKIYIIDEVHMLSTSAFNALLKTIEEPPPYVIFIFATTEIHRIPATIRSRCQKFTFRLLHDDEIVKELAIVCTESDIRAEESALAWIAREAEGSLRDAFMLFDQILVFSDGEMTQERIVQYLGLAMPEAVALMVRSIVQNKSAAAFEQLDELLRTGLQPERFVGRLLEYFRAMLFAKVGVSKLQGSEIDAVPGDLVDALSVEQIEQGLRILFDCHRNIRYTVNLRFEVELAVAELCQLRYYISSRELLEQARALQYDGPEDPAPITEDQKEEVTQRQELEKDATQEQDSKGDAIQEPKKKEAVAETRKKIASESLPASGASMMSDETQKLVERITKKDAALAQMLKQALHWEVDEKRLKIVLATTFTKERVASRSAIIHEAAAEIWGERRIVIEQETPSQKDEPDAVVEEIKDMFQGKVVEQ